MQIRGAASVPFFMAFEGRRVLKKGQPLFQNGICQVKGAEGLTMSFRDWAFSRFPWSGTPMEAKKGARPYAPF